MVALQAVPMWDSQYLIESAARDEFAMTIEWWFADNITFAQLLSVSVLLQVDIAHAVLSLLCAATMWFLLIVLVSASHHYH